MKIKDIERTISYGDVSNYDYNYERNIFSQAIRKLNAPTLYVYGIEEIAELEQVVMKQIKHDKTVASKEIRLRAIEEIADVEHTILNYELMYDIHFDEVTQTDIHDIEEFKALTNMQNVILYLRDKEEIDEQDIAILKHAVKGVQEYILFLKSYFNIKNEDVLKLRKHKTNRLANRIGVKEDSSKITVYNVIIALCIVPFVITLIGSFALMMPAKFGLLYVIATFCLLILDHIWFYILMGVIIAAMCVLRFDAKYR